MEGIRFRVVGTEILLFVNLDEEFTKVASYSKMRWNYVKDVLEMIFYLCPRKTSTASIHAFFK